MLNDCFLKYCLQKVLENNLFIKLCIFRRKNPGVVRIFNPVLNLLECTVPYLKECPEGFRYSIPYLREYPTGAWILNTLL